MILVYIDPMHKGGTDPADISHMTERLTEHCARVTDNFISANCIGATEAYMQFAKKAQAVFVEGLKEGMKGAR